MATETEVMRYPSFGNLILGLLLAIVILAGCAELPVSIRAPYSAAPPSYSAPWRPPPAVAANRAPSAGRPQDTVPVDSSAVYGLADLIDFAHRTNPETRRAWEEARAAAAQVARAEAAYYPTLFFMASRRHLAGRRRCRARWHVHDRGAGHQPTTAAQLDLARFRPPRLQC